ncbi:Ig-like domain-containing protein [Curtobacterium sp. MCPF17_046]|uniref:Ig-like domain-containing protein n=1 Tax=Curtobacterium sp. MCPF17_046 TaxID=2175663 RepID=UPI000D9DF3A0|nr:Ig-like domain-containing protein [Curtobacterium sp. MCPF17_046]PYY42263.1 fibronectin type III domain-containing protein [Curtobacterium sp. MCPF17_046]
MRDDRRRLVIRRLFRAHRSAALTSVVAVVVGAVVTGTALVSTGYHTQRVDLGDGTVWVPSAEYGAVGRANPGVLELNTAVSTSSDAVDVLQHGSTVYSVDRTKGTVARVDVADATLGDAVTLPAGSPDVFFAGRTAVVGNGDTGELWTTPASALEDFDASTKADLTLGADAVFDAADDRVAVYSPRTSTASLVDLGATPTVAHRWTVRMDRTHDLQVAAFGDHVAVLDQTDGVLAVDGRRVDLASRLGAAPALQRSSDGGASVTVAGATGLVRVGPSGSVDAVPLAVSGRAARPLVSGSCTYGAWNGGQAVDTCAGRAVQDLDRVPGGAALRIVHNGAAVVANDPESGRTWAVGRSGQLIDNWADLVDRADDRQQERIAEDDPEVQEDQAPPVAVDDDLGARPGRTTTLPVLLNDHDPNGDPLVVSEVGTVPAARGTVAIVSDGQRLQVTLPDDASGVLTFPYTITDGNGGSDTAAVRVTVRSDSVNEPPRQVRDTRADVVRGGHVTTNVLGDWIDPDGDPVFLRSATPSDGDAASTTPDGLLDYRNDSGRTGERTQRVVVSDGRDQGRGSVTVDVAAPGDVPLRADSFPVSGYAGKPFTVDPLDHVRGGNGTVTLTSVSSASGLTVTPSYDAGTFRVVARAAGDAQLEYTVTDGVKTTSGVVRVTVLAPPDASSAPVTTPKTVFVNTLGTKDTDVTATDSDPSGGVLLVTGLDGPADGSGVQASVLDQHVVRVTLTAPLAGPVSFRYTVSNGLASATGTVTVVEIPEPDRIQPPVAQPDTATVRVGDVTDIDVLANDTQPEGGSLTLLPDLVQDVPGGSGLLFVSGDRLRYLAPTTPGTYTAAYRVAGPDGQTADATVSISVRDRDRTTNSAPVPQTVTARVVAGQTVRIAVPLADTDPDGDSVQLVGVGSNPEKGAVTEVTTEALTYEAGDYSAGTDEFTYTVVDALGARATGTVRVGIAPRADQASDPVAQADRVTIRPGGTVTVRVLQNDSDPEGGRLRVASAEPTGSGVRARVLGGETVRVTPPASAREGDFAVLYTVTNERAGSSTAFLTVTVDPDASPLRPEVDDTVLDLQDVLGRDSVTIDVLRNVFAAEGTRADLRVGLVGGHRSGARVTDDDRVAVRITARSQVIPFSVALRDQPDVVSLGFVHVPGTDDALPQVDRSAPAVTVRSESTVRIPLDRYVVTATGRTATLTDRGAVKATHASGGSLVVDSSTLQFTSAELYYGNASISFEVTDGSDADGGKGRVATLVLPITVTPRSNQPPSLSGTTLELQPGDTRTLDLTKLTDYPYPADLPELRYSVVDRPGGGTTASVTGQRLTVRVPESARTGTSTSVGVGVADATNAGRAGRIVVDVVTSTRPLVQPAPDSAVVARGTTTTVDVLANDRPTNPFPGEPLRVTDIRGLGGGLPSGVSVTPSADRSRLRVTVARDARPVDAHLQYRVADVTGDTARSVWGDVTISVQDVPDAPGTPTRTGSSEGGRVTLSWSTPRANNSAITGYRVTGTNGVSQDCGTATVCTVTGLDPMASYRFSVTAANAVGRSDPSAQSAAMSADFVPAAPTGTTVGPDRTTPNRLDVRWDAVPRPSRGSLVDQYVVTVAGPGLSTTKTVRGATATTFDGALSGATYAVTVSARNDATRDGTAVQWNTGSATGAAVGTPGTVTALSASTGSTPDTDGRSTVTVTWGAADGQGGSGPSYAAYRIAAGSTPTCRSLAGETPVGTASGAVDRGVPAGVTRYAVVADNGLFCSVAVTDTVAYERPAAPVAPSVGLVASGQPNRVDARVTAPTTKVDHYRLDTGSGTVDLAPGDSWTGVPGAGSRNTAVKVALQACGAPGDAFCSDRTSATAGALDLAASVTTAAHGHPIVVSGPDGSAVGSVRYTATWYDADGTVLPAGDGNLWDGSSVGPTPPTDASTVSVRASVTTSFDADLTRTGTDSDSVDVGPDPDAPAPDPAPIPGQGEPPGTGDPPGQGASG